MNKTRKNGLRKRRLRIAKLHAADRHAPTPQKGPRAERTTVTLPIPTLALTPLPRR